MTEIEKRILHNQKVIMDALLTIIINSNYQKSVDCGMDLIGAMNETLQQIGESEE